MERHPFDFIHSIKREGTSSFCDIWLIERGSPQNEEIEEIDGMWVSNWGLLLRSRTESRVNRWMDGWINN